MILTKKKFIEQIKKETEDTQLITCTTDSWTNCSNKRLMSITVGYNSAEFEQISHALAVVHVNEETLTTEVITKNRETILLKYSIPNEKIVLVTDGGRNFTASASSFNKQVRCFGHRLNNDVVQQGVEHVDNIVNKVQNIVTHVRKSAKLTTILEKIQIDEGKEPLKLVQNVITRWNSTYLMLSRFEKLYCCIKKMDMNVQLPDDVESEEIAQIVKLLSLFDEATLSTSAEKKCTISLVLQYCDLLATHCHQLADFYNREAAKIQSELSILQSQAQKFMQTEKEGKK